MIFSSVEECDKIRRFATPSNEENFDRLESILNSIKVNLRKFLIKYTKYSPC
jgi:hypothetical protein